MQKAFEISEEHQDCLDMLADDDMHLSLDERVGLLACAFEPGSELRLILDDLEDRVIALMDDAYSYAKKAGLTG